MADRQTEQHIIVASQQYYGPIPQASELIKYNEACPDAADRILTMAEAEAKHRQAMEARKHKDRVRVIYMSMVCAALCVLILSTVIVYAIYKGQTTAAVSTSIAAVASVAGIFIYYKKVQ